MKGVKAWDSRGGTSTVVMVAKERQPDFPGDAEGNILFVFGNLGWMGPFSLKDGDTALTAGAALAESWGLQECEDPNQYCDPDPSDDDGEDEDDAEAQMWADAEPDYDPDEDRTP